MKIENKFILFACALSLLAQPVRALGNSWLVPDKIFKNFRAVESWPIFGEEVFEQCWAEDQPCSGSREEAKTSLVTPIVEKSQHLATPREFNDNARNQWQGPPKNLQPAPTTSQFPPWEIPHESSNTVDSNNFRNPPWRSPAEYFNGHNQPANLPPFGRSSGNTEAVFLSEETAGDENEYEENPGDARFSDSEEPQEKVLKVSASPVYEAFILCAYLNNFAEIVNRKKGKILIKDREKFVECSFKYANKRKQACDYKSRIRALGLKFDGNFDKPCEHPIPAQAKNSAEFNNAYKKVKRAYSLASSRDKTKAPKRKQVEQQGNSKRKKRRKS